MGLMVGLFISINLLLPCEIECVVFFWF